MTTATTHEIIDALQTFDTHLLAAIAQGEVDATALVREVLARRGMNEAGRWVGFSKTAATGGLIASA